MIRKSFVGILFVALSFSLVVADEKQHVRSEEDNIEYGLFCMYDSLAWHWIRADRRGNFEGMNMDRARAKNITCYPDPIKPAIGELKIISFDKDAKRKPESEFEKKLETSFAVKLDSNTKYRKVISRNEKDGFVKMALSIKAVKICSVCHPSYKECEIVGAITYKFKVNSKDEKVAVPLIANGDCAVCHDSNPHYKEENLVGAMIISTPVDYIRPKH